MTDEIPEVRVRGTRPRSRDEFYVDGDDESAERARERRDPRFRDPFDDDDKPPARSPPPDIPEVEVTARRPPAEPDWFTWRGQSGPRDVWRELFNRRPDIGREVISDLEYEETLEWERALRKAKGDIVKAREIFRAALIKAGYVLGEIEGVLLRVSGAARRAAETFAPEATEVVIRAARTPAARILGSGAFGAASALVEGVLTVGGILSRDSTRRYVERFTPPPAAPVPPPAPNPFPPPQAAPIPAPQGDAPFPVVVISAPRPTPRPPPRGFGFSSPFGFTGSAPSFGVGPRTGGRPGAGTSSPLGPRGLTRLESTPVRSPLPRGRIRVNTQPQPAPGPSFQSPLCPPQQQQRKRKKKTPREVCYRGEYVERRNGLMKFRERKIPCK